MRNKLIELLAAANVHAMNQCSYTGCDDCIESYENGGNCINALIADYLLDNGLTIPQWIPVSDRLPENDYGKHWKDRKQYLVIMSNGMYTVCRFGYKEYGWWIDRNDSVIGRFNQVVKWMELEPPKENEDV